MRSAATRVLLLGLALASAVASGAVAQTTLPERSEHVHFRELFVESRAGGGRERVLVTWPRHPDGSDHPAGERLPIVVALHGRGEAAAGMDEGYLGWAVLYGLPDAVGALMRGRLRRGDFGGFVRDAHLEARNASLAATAFRGALVVTPYTPDLADEEPGSAAITAYADWISGPVLTAVRERFDFAAQTREGTGIDGVSLGGMIALEVGLRHPETFGAVGAIQPAISERFEALGEIPSPDGDQRIRLLSSDDDPFLAPTMALADHFTARRVEHDMLVVPGPHGYAFNRGPGSIELLWFADRVLAHEPL